MYATAPAVVLIVDSDPCACTGTAAVLSLQGYQCFGVGDAAAALEAARSLSPDVIICDVRVDRRGGAALIGRVREQGELADVPVLFLSGTQLPDVIRRSDAAGGVYYLRKPCDPQVLIALVHKALEIPQLVRRRLDRLPAEWNRSAGRTASPFAPRVSQPRDTSAGFDPQA